MNLLKWLAQDFCELQKRKKYGGLIISHKWSGTEERNSQERLCNIVTLILFLSKGS